MNSIKEFFMKEKENQVIRKDNLLILVLAGILMLVICIPIKPSQKSTAEEKSSVTKENSGNILTDSNSDVTEQTGSAGELLRGTEEYIAAMEQKLEDALICMEGVGKVKVMLTLKSSGEQIVEKDIPNTRSNLIETDSQGGNRNSNEMENNETTVYLTNSDGEKIPYVIKQMEPIVDGIVVVAQGGGNAECCKNITEVVQALFGIEPHKIKVVKMRTSK